jgi:hypothetical protein
MKLVFLDENKWQKILAFLQPKESTDEIEKTQEIPGQFVKTRK